MISLLFAMDKNRVIGKDHTLPWYLPNDLKFFKRLTTSQTIIMGRKTFDSMNGPLPNRNNIVITHDQSFTHPDCKVIHNIEDIQKLNQEQPNQEWFVIGGEEIFRQVLDFADRIYMTYIDASFEGDTFFPTFDGSNWEMTDKQMGVTDEKNKYDHYFITYDRKK
ncbi:dihydrofolate reductase [Gracilibacillus halophilus YIM-C55.5]|uniref:Dihydrofolate reductase n=1 Tax=Gracilibacillus halophilus YIM-C55.5 TaxID=1308866 RepID=N4WM92_9BACI|nr:dihydrofolate reductase [Gracilibacillus halophilus]ENH97297.1 dihydrofolate reductase [Gracilibacillus halophilus YIM-C55.5]